ncbi:MAG: leucyl/phenylalanyl-tRNA--protein transferase [Hydrogenophaga sp.]|uniref:leucyl/phenylalanyl-tRNA--protein transferase n=1 Tax=Hydrogenophaga sp. TaxID=1904254 RepID=UPI00272FA12C|nr:leucyl/phenylalanyl-tRNA--protein transferase [Hydrogenophaga sp.]MDP2164520.1 leucyl/phenylalanyl-tRNA--protein transferase [Hydrogenophaga sp.]
MPFQPPPLPWLAPGQDFPPASQAWGENSPAPGLLTAGGGLDADTLCRAYRKGIFPWFSEGQPILWWSPNPRMVLDVTEFRLHPSFKKTLQKFCKTAGCEIRIDSAFEQVIQACSTSPRAGQAGTWIVPDMIAAYGDLHRAGLAHSVETWVNGQLVGGLYCVALGKSVFGESMFSRTSDASKIALAALVCFCCHHAIRQIDCQQNTRHLTALGAREISRDLFVQQMAAGLIQAAPAWQFDPLYWQELLPSKSTQT